MKIGLFGLLAAPIMYYLLVDGPALVGSLGFVAIGCLGLGYSFEILANQIFFNLSPKWSTKWGAQQFLIFLIMIVVAEVLTLVLFFMHLILLGDGFTENLTLDKIVKEFPFAQFAGFLAAAFWLIAVNESGGFRTVLSALKTERA